MVKRILYVDVFIVDVQYPGVAARWQQFKNIQTGEVVEQHLLIGWTIYKTFTDTFGRMCMTLKSPE